MTPSLVELAAEKRARDQADESFRAPVRACAPRGVMNGAVARRKLTPDQVLEARDQIAAGESCAVVGRRLGVTGAAIGQLAAGKTYAWVQEVRR